MTGLDDEVAKLHTEAQRADLQAKEWRRQAAERREEILALQRQAAVRLKALQVGSRLVLLKSANWFDNPDFGRDEAGGVELVLNFASVTRPNTARPMASTLSQSCCLRTAR